MRPDLDPWFVWALFGEANHHGDTFRRPKGFKLADDYWTMYCMGAEL